jgi:hypothetical protein
MTDLLRPREGVGEAAPGGFLEAFAGVFQVAYVTHDREVAERELTVRLELAVAFARAGRVEIELIQPIAGETAIFIERLPARGLVAVHHLGVRVEDIALALEHSGAAGYRCCLSGQIEGHLRYAFVDTTGDLGHYTELAQFTAAGWDFVAGILEAHA